MHDVVRFVVKLKRCDDSVPDPFARLAVHECVEVWWQAPRRPLLVEVPPQPRLQIVLRVPLNRLCEFAHVLSVRQQRRLRYHDLVNRSTDRLCDTDAAVVHT